MTSMNRTILPYGNWPSVITADMVAGRSVRFGMTAAEAGVLYWSESRPEEKGRGAIMRRDPDGTVRECLPAPWSARSRVHEYGGGEFTVAGGAVYFVNDADQDIHVIDIDGGAPVRITDAPGWRFADMAVDRARNRLIAVAERHECDHDPSPENMLVSIDLAPDRRGRVETLVAGRDFYAAPRLSPDGRRLAWLEWSLPAMPWEAAELHMAQFDEAGRPTGGERLAGGSGNAVFQPEWDRSGALWFVWDSSGWGNLHRWRSGAIVNMAPLEIEFGRPLWALGMRSYAILEDGNVLASVFDGGAIRCVTVNADTGAVAKLDGAVRSADAITALGNRAGAFAGFDDAPPAVVLLEPKPNGHLGVETIRSSADVALDPDDISPGRPVTFESGDGGRVHGIHYPPASARWRGPSDGLPPAVVMVHGGPTGYADRGLKLKIQYWTSRGFAVLDVDFTGSFGYGSAYRNALNGHWGLRDAADAAAGARWLAAEGLADPARIVITGGSSGGYTALSALVHHDVFAGAASYYGISDVGLLARTTHKFESGYTATLTGIPADAPDEAYRAISPIANAERISRPVILFQGDRDRVVPPEQSIAIAESLGARGVPVHYVEYAGEGHGFRQAQTLIDAIGREHAFYARILGLEPADDLPDLDTPTTESES